MLGNSGKITGSTIQVNYYGAVNTPLNLAQVCTNSYCQRGVQTIVTATQPELGMFKVVEEKRIKTVRKITNSLKIEELYQNSVPISIPEGALKVVKEASTAMKENFEKDTSCLALVGQNYGIEKELEFGVVSYLNYQTCTSWPNWLSVTIKHDFVTMDGTFICSQESSTLFTVNQDTGETSKFVGC